MHCATHMYNTPERRRNASFVLYLVKDKQFAFEIQSLEHRQVSLETHICAASAIK